MSASPVNNAQPSLDLAQAARRRFVPWEWALVFLAALILYAATANRGIQWQDSGYFVVSIMTGEWRNPLGLALSHPLHHALGRLFTLPGWFEPSLAVTLVSAVAGAAAVANVFGCVRTLTASNGAALYAAASLGIAHTFWKLSTVTEVYTVSAALLAAECWALVAFCRSGRRQHLWLMLLFNGLGIANHVQNALTLPVLAIVAVGAWRGRRVSFRDLGVGIAIWVIASLPYAGMVVAEALRRGAWMATFKSAFFGESFVNYANNVFNVVPSLRVIAVSFGFTLLCFPSLFLPASLYGLLAWKRWAATYSAGWVLIAGLLLHAGFAARYNVVDQYTFFLPTYVLLAVFAGIGAAAALRNQRRGLTVLAGLMLAATPLVYVAVTPLARHAGVLDRVIHHKPYRDDYVYLLTPWAVADGSAERMSREAVELAGPDGVLLVEDLMAQPAIEYQLLRRGWDAGRIILVSPSHPDETAATAQAIAPDYSVVLVPLNTSKPPPEFGGSPIWRRVGDLFVRTPGNAGTQTTSDDP